MESDKTTNTMASQDKPSIFEARESKLTEEDRATARRSHVRNSCGIMKGLHGERTY